MTARRLLPVILASALLLASCGSDESAVQPEAVARARAEIERSEARPPRPVDPARASETLDRIEAALRPAARAVCRERGGTICEWRVSFRPDPTFNAYASGRNDIVMLAGVFGQARNEAEIAMVLAHEKAHHILDHIVETNRNAGIGALAADLLVGLGATWLADALGLPLPAVLVEQARRAAAGAGAQAGVLAFSVANEKEADALAAEILARSGIDPAEARGMMLAMGAMGRDDRTPALLRTHPAGPERLAHWDALSSKLARGQ
jgi:Zn-dependent protease with chaperone function